MLRSKRIMIVALTVVAMSGLLIASVTASSCVKQDEGCTSTTNSTIFTGEPTILCQVPYPVVRVISSATCLRGGGSAGPVTVLRCGNSSEPFSYSGGKYTHKIGVAKGFTWQYVVSDCSKLVYSAGRS